MKKINKIVLVMFLFLAVLEIGNSQITKSKYEMVFDETTCEYSMYLHVLEGDAVTLQERFPLNGGIALILPVEAQGTITEELIPGNTSWSYSNITAAPGGDEDKTFFIIGQVVISNTFYPEMHPGDILLLFKFSLSEDVQGIKGVRPYDGQIDNPGGGGVYGTSTVIGSPADSHVGFLPTTFASEYAEAIGPSVIYVDKETTLSPLSGGTWTQSNPSATSFDLSNKVVTGLGVGRSLFTFTPTNNDCPTSVVIAVIPDGPLVDLVGIGEGVGDQAVEFGIYGTKDGILIPRMTTNERLCIVTPAAGLLVFQTNSEEGFYYYTGQTWNRLSDTTTGGTSNQQNMVVSNQDQILLGLLEKQEALNKQYETQKSELIELSKKVNQY